MYNINRSIFLKKMIAMTMTKVEIDVPEEIVPYTVLEDKDAQITRNAMLVYPYIKSGVMSHEKAAEMLGLHKIDLITLYGKLGLPYFDETEEDLVLFIFQRQYIGS